MTTQTTMASPIGSQIGTSWREGEPVALRGGGENVINSKNHDAYCDDYRVPDKYGGFDEEQPYSLPCGGASRTSRTTKNKTLIRQKAAMQEIQ